MKFILIKAPNQWFNLKKKTVLTVVDVSGYQLTSHVQKFLLPLWILIVVCSLRTINGAKKTERGDQWICIQIFMWASKRDWKIFCFFLSCGVFLPSIHWGEANDWTALEDTGLRHIPLGWMILLPCWFIGMCQKRWESPGSHKFWAYIDEIFLSWMMRFSKDGCCLGTVWRDSWL